jgi:hypothetical protein
MLTPAGHSAESRHQVMIFSPLFESISINLLLEKLLAGRVQP